MNKSFRKNIVSKDYLMLNNFFKAIRFAFRRRKNDQNKIAVICFKLIGDSVFTIPAVKYLRNVYPDKKIVFFTYKYNKAVYESIFSDLEYETYPKDEIDLDSPFIRFNLLKKIWAHNPELIVDFTSGIFVATLLLFSRSRVNVGFNLPVFKTIYDTFLQKRDIPHLVDMYVEPLKKHFHQEDLPIDYSFPVSIEQNGIIAICPLAGWKAKEWGLKNFFDLGLILNRDYKVKFILPLNALDKDIHQEFVKEKMDIVFTKDTDELIEELKKVSFVISNDSGPVYIGNMLGKPTFTIYGPTNPAYSLPFGKYHGYVRKEIKCSPEKNHQYCFTNAGRSCVSYDCMNFLSIEQVSFALSDFIQRLGITKSKDVL